MNNLETVKATKSYLEQQGLNPDNYIIFTTGRYIRKDLINQAIEYGFKLENTQVETIFNIYCEHDGHYDHRGSFSSVELAIKAIKDKPDEFAPYDTFITEELLDVIKDTCPIVKDYKYNKALDILELIKEENINEQI